MKHKMQNGQDVLFLPPGSCTSGMSTWEETQGKAQDCKETVSQLAWELLSVCPEEL